MSKAFDLAGRVAIVTGGNGGIGLGMARGLAQAGASVVGVNARNLRVAAEIDLRRIHALAGDVDGDRILVAESGIASGRDAAGLPSRAGAILVGTALVRATDPAPLIKELADARKAAIR